jgi:uncharacterized membrane protein
MEEFSLNDKNKTVYGSVGFKIFFIIVVLAFILSIISLSKAQQLHVVTSSTTKVQNPEISQAFYGQLNDTKNTFEIDSDKPFQLYVGLMIPDTKDVQKNISLNISSLIETPGENGETMQKNTTLAMLDGTKSDWTSYYDPITGNKYLKGPEYNSSGDGTTSGNTELQPGKYYIQILNMDDNGKYVLSVGNNKKNTLEEMLNNLQAIPKVEMTFWGKSIVAAYFNMVGLFILSSVMIVVLIVLIIRNGWIRKKNKKSMTDQDFSDMV